MKQIVEIDGVAQAGAAVTMADLGGPARRAAQLAAAGIGVAIVPSSALTSRPAGVVCHLAPPVRRDIVVIVAWPSDTLAARFAADLRRRGVPAEQSQGVPV